MHSAMCSMVFLTVMVTMGLAKGLPRFAMCDMGQFYNVESNTCVSCSQCPLNEIIWEPCTPTQDTVCGPFYEFEFNQGGGQPENKVQNADLQDRITTKSPCESSANERTEKEPCFHHKSEKWQELCYGLIAALVVLSVVFIVYAVVAHIQISRLHAKVKKTTVTDSEDETIYCYTHLCTGEEIEPASTPSVRRDNHHRIIRHAPIYRPSQSRRIAKPNEYIVPQNNDAALNNLAADTNVAKLHNVQHFNSSSASNRLLQVIPEGNHLENCDHVNVLYNVES